MSKGKIRPEYWASCGLCGQEWCITDTVPSTGHAPRTKAEVIEVLKSIYGWKETAKDGWTCANHRDG